MTWVVAYDPKDVVPEIEHRMVVLAQKTRPKRRPVIRHAGTIFEMMGEGAFLDREAFWVLPLDGKSRLIGCCIMSIGGTSSTSADPLSILRLLLATQAEKVIVVHNHPSGYNRPSRDDVVMTETLVRALDAFQIELVDHVIIANVDRFYSFKERGLL